MVYAYVRVLHQQEQHHFLNNFLMIIFSVIRHLSPLTNICFEDFRTKNF